MKLPVQALRNMYCTLASLPPFDRYNFPCDAAVDFKVTCSQMDRGAYDTDPHSISISKKASGHENYTDILMTVAHEMVHMALERRGAANHAYHDADFNALAAKVCDAWGWNFKEF